MAKIVLIGAGSHVFSRHLITDILSYPELRDSTISMMDIANEPLELITAFAKKIVKQNGFENENPIHYRSSGSIERRRLRYRHDKGGRTGDHADRSKDYYQVRS